MCNVDVSHSYILCVSHLTATPCPKVSDTPTDKLMYKKLSYCCESRSYWLQKYDRLKQLLRDTLSVLTPGLPYIHCDRSVSTCE